MPRKDAKTANNMWWVRITAPHEHIASKIPVIQQWIDYSGCMVAYHTGDKDVPNPHAHIALKLKSMLQKQSLDVRIKKLFDVAGSNYANVPWDGDVQVLRYCYHEQVDDGEAKVTNLLGLTEAEITKLKTESKMINEAVAEAKKSASFKIVDFMLDKIKASGKMTAYEIGWEIQKAVYRGDYHEPGDYNMEKYINEILCRQCEDETELETMWAERTRRLKVFQTRNIF